MNSQQPLIIEIENKNDKEINNVSLFGAFRVFNDFFTKKEIILNNVEIKSKAPNVDYSDFLLETISNKINLQKIIFISDIKLFECNLINKTKDVNGNFFQRTLLSELVLDDEMKKEQIESNHFKIEKEIIIDCFTELVIPKISPKSKITIYLY